MYVVVEVELRQIIFFVTAPSRLPAAVVATEEEELLDHCTATSMYPREEKGRCVQFLFQVQPETIKSES